MASYALQATFNKGEISPLLKSRADIDHWRAALNECVNFFPLRHGGLQRRSGSRYIAEVKDSAHQPRLLPFRFSASQAYVLEMGNTGSGYVRFFTERGQVVSGASPYEIASPYAKADLARIQHVQSADVMHLAHPDYAGRKLSRLAETNWTLEAVTFNDGPYMPRVKGARLTLSGYANPAIGGTPSTADLFDNNRNTAASIAAGARASVQLVTAKIVRDYTLIARQSTRGGTSGDVLFPGGNYAPSAWIFQGSQDGLTWVDLDSRSGERGWDAQEARTFSFENDTAYLHYGILLKAAGEETSIKLAELVLGEWGAALTATASTTDGINGGAGFKATDVGRLIGIVGSDGFRRWLKITAHTSSTQVEVEFYGPGLEEVGCLSWQLGAFSDETGYPGAVSYFHERLTWARTAAQPQSIWASKAGGLEEYGASVPLQTDDGLAITMLASDVNEIEWLAEGQDLVMGTPGSIRTIGPSDVSQPFSASNLEQNRQTTYGAAGLAPIQIGTAILYASANGRKVRELIYSFESGSYIAPELSVLSEHVFKAAIVDWGFAQDPTPTIWAALGDGGLASITYDREQQVLGFARHEIADGAVESVAVIPNADGWDDVYMVVKRTIGGATKRYIEVLERPFDSDLQEQADAFFVDSGLSYSGASTSTITGLSHLEGEEVAVLGDGAVQNRKTVSGGSITLDSPVTSAQVGLPYTSFAETLRFAGPQQDGVLFGRRRTVQAAFIDVHETGGLSVGPRGREERVVYLHAGENLGQATPLRSGVFPCQFDSSWLEAGQVAMKSDDPVPALIRSLTLQLDGEP